MELDATGDDQVRDAVLQSILDTARFGSVEGRKGNSLEDLRLSVRGYRLGGLLRSGDLAGNKELALWIALNVAGD